MTLLYNEGIINVVETKQWSEGVHFPQMGEKAIKILRKIKEADGFLITNGEHAAMMTDIIEIDHFHIGKVRHTMTSQVMGIPKGSGFIQFVPAGVRTTLAYPTPVQTSKDFDRVLNSERFKSLKNHYGEKKIFDILKKDAVHNGTPIEELLYQIDQKINGGILDKKVDASYVGGVYADGLPWSGIMAKVDIKKYAWNFVAHIASNKPKNVPSLIQEFKKENNFEKGIELAWNGGYILNPELVGKLGLSEAYIGSPLGLLMMNSKIAVRHYLINLHLSFIKMEKYIFN